MVIPMKGQYEQQCNAAAIKTLGVPVIKSLKKKHLEKIRSWAQSKQMITIDWPDNTEEIINMIIDKHAITKQQQTASLGDGIYSVKKLKDKSLGKILNKISDQ